MPEAPSCRAGEHGPGRSACSPGARRGSTSVAGASDRPGAGGATRRDAGRAAASAVVVVTAAAVVVVVVVLVAAIGMAAPVVVVATAVPARLPGGHGLHVAAVLLLPAHALLALAIHALAFDAGLVPVRLLARAEGVLAGELGAFALPADALPALARDPIALDRLRTVPGLLLVPLLACHHVLLVPVILHEVDRHVAGPVLAAVLRPVRPLHLRHPQVDRRLLRIDRLGVGLRIALLGVALLRVALLGVALLGVALRIGLLVDRLLA